MDFMTHNFTVKIGMLLHDKYKEICVIASTTNDFADMYKFLTWRVEFKPSKIYGTGKSRDTKDATGLLGVELMPTKDGMKSSTGDSKLTRR